MTDQNPYAAPAPTPEESPERLKPASQSLRDALWRGAKFGFKWGNRAGAVVCGSIVLIFAGVIVFRCVSDGRPPHEINSKIWIEFLNLIGGVFYVYLVFCIFIAFVGSVASGLEYFCQKLVSAIRGNRV